MDFSIYLPSVSLDCVIFSFHQQSLKVILLKMRGIDRWALPGGFIAQDQDLNAGASEVLKLRTGLENIFLRQFHVFGAQDRTGPEHVRLLVKQKILTQKEATWFLQRFISIGYYALVNYEEVLEPRPDEISEACSWVELDAVPQLVLDHEQILAKALEHLRKDLHYQPIGLNLLPEEFTLPELQTLYEKIIGKKLDRRNFRRKMLSHKILIDTQKRRTGLGHKAPILYKFDKTKYLEALDRGFQSSEFY